MGTQWGMQWVHNEFAMSTHWGVQWVHNGFVMGVQWANSQIPAHDGGGTHVIVCL